MRNLIASFACLAACHSTPSTNATPDAAVSVDSPAADAGPSAVTFTYTPSWSGVTAVEVLGGTSTDMTTWTTLATLTQSGAAWTGTATLAAGTYNYLFSATGDASAGGQAATLVHQALDPTVAAFAICPLKNGDMNTCSTVTVPQVATTPTLYTVSGKVVVGANPGASFLVVLEREEPTTHHTFVDRTNTAADGTFSFSAAPGNYRFQVQHPEYESKTDSQLAPATLGLLRRDISGAFMLSAAKTISNVDMAYASYATFAPNVTTQQALPTTFTFPTTASARLDVYSGPKEIGDPWYTAAATTSGSATFAMPGTFNTPQATQTMVVAATQYYWGIEIPHAADASGLTWTSQTMVLPITWSN